VLPALAAGCVAPAERPAESEAVSVVQPVTTPTPAAPNPASPSRTPLPAGPSTFVYSGELTQGGWLRGRVPAGTVSARLDNKPLTFESDGQFFAAFDRDAASTATLSATLGDGRTIESPLAVSPRAWQIEQIDASPTANVPSAEFKARRRP